MLEPFESWTDAVDRGMALDIVYCDYQKTFDTVPHKHLLKNLSAHDLKGQVPAWLQNFLSDMQQEVTVGGITSSSVKFTSCVPQGSMLGPVLYVLYVNDLPKLVKSDFKMFADDVKVLG